MTPHRASIRACIVRRARWRAPVSSIALASLFLFASACAFESNAPEDDGESADIASDVAEAQATRGKTLRIAFRSEYRAGTDSAAFQPSKRQGVVVPAKLKMNRRNYIGVLRAYLEFTRTGGQKPVVVEYNSSSDEDPMEPISNVELAGTVLTGVKSVELRGAGFGAGSAVVWAELDVAPAR